MTKAERVTAIHLAVVEAARTIMPVFAPNQPRFAGEAERKIADLAIERLDEAGFFNDL